MEPGEVRVDAAQRIRWVGAYSGYVAPTRVGPNQSKGAAPILRAGAGRAGRATTRTSKGTSTTSCPSWGPDERTARLVNVFGNKGLADLLGVSQSQPSRWKSAQEVPGPAVAARLVDLDHVLARLLLVWDQSVVLDWLTGSNAFLQGARPIDVIATRGTNEVVDAIEAEASGAYA
jgi:hypothetical protein